MSRSGSRSVKAIALSIFVLTLFAALLAAFPAKAAKPPIALGDTVTLGSYGGNPIVWRCVSFEKVTGYDEEGNPVIDSTDTAVEYKSGYLPLMLADNILCDKAFDASGKNTSGSHGRGYYYNGKAGCYRQWYGSDYWGDSNLRDWLNSSASAGNVVWSCGNAPDASHVSGGKDPYADEAGFLTHFTSDEKAMIQKVTQKSLLNVCEENTTDENTENENYHKYSLDLSGVSTNYASAYCEQVTDSVFLLDVRQLQTVYENRTLLGRDSYFGQYFDGSIGHYWLRSTSAVSYEGKAREMSDSYSTCSSLRAYTANGVRPAFFLDVSSFGGVISSVSSVGDTITMGEYGGKPIVWRCVSFEKIAGYDEKGNPVIDSTDTVTEYKDGYLPLMLCERVLCYKAFDACGTNASGSHGRGYYSGGQAGKNRLTYGSNFWGDSNLRDWLNSNAAAGSVVWTCGNAPVSENVSGKNPYADEAGFLTNFTAGELTQIASVTQKSLLNRYEENTGSSNSSAGEWHEFESAVASVSQNYASAYCGQTTDSVFLLDARQIQTVYENRSVLGDKYHVGNYDDGTTGGVDAATWLRTPLCVNQNDANVRYVSIYGSVYSEAADASGIGVRPAFFLKVSVPSRETIALGDVVTLGRYNGRPIAWRCVAFEKVTGYDGDGNPIIDSTDAVTEYKDGYLPLMLCETILCEKAFDAKGTDASGSHGRGYYESGVAGYARRRSGSNHWGDSNLRDWLNSKAAAGKVVWSCGNAPDASRVYNGVNPYADEAGFLTSFTPAERTVIVTVSQFSLLDRYEENTASYNLSNNNYHQYDDDVYSVSRNYDRSIYGEEVVDSVFLLDVMQLQTVYDNGETLGWDCYVGRHEDGTAGQTWLRTPLCAGNDGSLVRLVDPDGSVVSGAAYAGNGGVRPAFFLKLSSPAEGPEVPEGPVALGDTITLGRYDGKPIVWRCVAFEKVTGYDGDGNPIIDSSDTVTEYKDGYLPLMLCETILCEKAFDAAGTNTSGSHGRGYYTNNVVGYHRRQCGSNYWGDSNLRCWLNSGASAGNVVWLCGNPPTDEIMGVGKGYAGEAGFLSGFTPEELSRVQTVTQKSLLNMYEENTSSANTAASGCYSYVTHNSPEVLELNYATAYCEQVTDSFFLPDVMQIKTVYENRAILGDDYYVGRRENGEAGWTWSRTPHCTAGDDFTIGVNDNGKIAHFYDYSVTGGVRPAFFLRLPETSGLVRGDADSSGACDVFDAVTVLSYIVDSVKNPLTSEQLSAADADLSGGVDVFDAVAILTYIVKGGWE